MVQRPFNFAIVDEVDSILIDEARTPLIISGPTDDKSDLYISVDAIVKKMEPGVVLRSRREDQEHHLDRGGHRAKVEEYAGGSEGLLETVPTSTMSRTRRWSTTSTRR